MVLTLIILLIRGMFVCRTLSYKGAEFDVVEAPLDPMMTVCQRVYVPRLGDYKLFF